MTSNRKIVRAFLASPGDLVPERRIAKRVVDEFNNIWADQLGCQVELVGWEQTVTSFGRPQELINRDLARCELFIGMMWKRWGTPPDINGTFTSGFEEEFKTSLDRRKRGESQPEINLFFKDVDPELLGDPGSELRKVLEFKAQLIDEKTVLFETFGSEEEFREKLQRCVSHYVQSVVNADNATEREKEEPRSSAASGGRSVETISSSGSLSGEAAKFLVEIAPRVERKEGSLALGLVEVARLRLIGGMERRHGNDEQYLGAHDNNILFVNRKNLKLEDREFYSLVDSGLEHFSSENAPLWCWLAALNAGTGLLTLYSLYGSPSHRAAAISAMRTIEEPIGVKVRTREEVLNSWLGPDIPDTVKVAALQYLADFGGLSDLSVIRAEFDRDNYQTRTKAVEALLRINMKESRARAVKTVIELQPLGVDAKLLDKIFANGGSLSTSLLQDALTYRNSKVRAIAGRILSQRNALSVETAEELLSDEDASVRYEALSFLHKSGRRYSEEEAKRVLVKPRNVGLGGLFGSRTDLDGEACLSKFLDAQLAALPIRDLEAEAEKETLATRSAWYILAKRRWNALGEKVRASIDDQHRSELRVDHERLIKLFGAESEVIKGREPIEGFVRERSMRKALDVLCEMNDPEDLDRVRAALRGGSVPYSEKDTAYLKQWGEWEDITLIIESVERMPPSARGGLSLLTIGFDDSHYEAAAKAIYKLGKDRYAELLKLPASDNITTLLILEASGRSFARLTDGDVLTLFRSKNEAVRKAAALKSIRCLPRTRLKNLMDAYLTAEETYYYNVVHWLDMGLSIPRDRTMRAADLAIRRLL